MQFDNQTPFPAALDMGSTSDHEQLGMLTCRVSYQWDDQGALTPLPAAAMWPVTTAPQRLDGVMLLPDADFRREGIDILVFGEAVAPAGQPVTQMRAGFASGRFVRQFDVIGDRHWRRQGAQKEWGMSEPQLFVRMPMGCDRAFGGSAIFAEQPRPYAMNPLGRGYALEESNLASVLLPNIERIDQRITQWRDTPVPACWHKPTGGLLFPASGPDSWAQVASDPQRLGRVGMQQSFQQAPPDLVCPRGALGVDYVLKGFHADGLVRCALPPEVASRERGAVAYVEVGALRAAFPLRIVTVIVLVAHRLLVVSFATQFRYLMQPGDRRRTILRWHGETAFAVEAAA